MASARALPPLTTTHLIGNSLPHTANPSPRHCARFSVRLTPPARPDTPDANLAHYLGNRLINTYHLSFFDPDPAGWTLSVKRTPQWASQSPNRRDCPDGRRQLDDAAPAKAVSSNGVLVVPRTMPAWRTK
ncbi:hypothetical protein B0H11DRAFT_1940096 [Mycena galericulata]|nr:hypothetical protein B0H11DRAFT_1940096 [Mycena galericulata]